jgi:hypothetical protein
MVEERLFRDEFDSDDEADVREVVDYIRESHSVLLEDAGEPCYILHRLSSGSMWPLTVVSSWTETSPAHKKAIWVRGSTEVPPVMHPNVNPYVNAGGGAIEVWIDGVKARRVIHPDDISSDDQFSVVKEPNGDVSIVFKRGLNLGSATVLYQYSNLCECVHPPSLQPSEQCKRCFGASFDGGYAQYSGSTSATPYIRFPSVAEELARRTEFGDVRIRRTVYWTLRTPRLYDRDVFIPASPDSPHYMRRFRIINWQLSSLAGFPLHQRFEANELQSDDLVYDADLTLYTIQPPEEIGPDD